MCLFFARYRDDKCGLGILVQECSVAILYARSVVRVEVVGFEENEHNRRRDRRPDRVDELLEARLRES
ncbi:protein of unknown function [Micropruina glycogenica]|uniref:Uncharacterized protein n=1 Tax=Micropruina glycogenica TaxID=75385 RepID=A0A2N9JFP8_9ACTN|nr:protein of unknown function [Micropruina glycogenica]